MKFELDEDLSYYLNPVSFRSLLEVAIAGKIQLFLKTRRRTATRRYVRRLLTYLSDKRATDTMTDGWVLALDMRKDLVKSDIIPNTSTFYKLVTDLENAALIEKRVGKKIPSIAGGPVVYYRVPRVYPEGWFVTPEEMIAARRMSDVQEAQRFEQHGEEIYKDVFTAVRTVPHLRDAILRMVERGSGQHAYDVHGGHGVQQVEEIYKNLEERYEDVFAFIRTEPHLRDAILRMKS